VWKVTACFSIAFAVCSGIAGAATIVEHIERPRAAAGLGSSRPQRLAAALRRNEGEDAAPPALLYALVALGLVALALAIVSQVPGGNQQWPSDLHAEDRAELVAVLIALSAVPWLVVVWLLQRTLKARINDTFSLVRLREIWSLLETIVLAFAALVVFALVPTGALRVAYFADDKDPADAVQGAQFPASDVLLYGAFFAVLLSMIAVPLVASYRSAARRRIELRVPLADEPPSEQTKDDLDRMEALLHLDVSLLRSPITALTVFTPLITAVLAGYLPDLASK
jgi:hypothetical protein